MVEWVPKTEVLGTYLQYNEEMGSRQVEQGFSSYLAKFLPYIFDDFSKRIALMVMRNFEKSTNLGKYEGKALFDLHSVHFTQNSNFGYPQY